MSEFSHFNYEVSELNRMASDLIFESDLLKSTNPKDVPTLVGNMVWLDDLDLTQDEFDYVVKKTIELLPILGWEHNERF